MIPLEFPIEFGSAKGIAGGGEPGGGRSQSATGVLKSYVGMEGVLWSTDGRGDVGRRGLRGRDSLRSSSSSESSNAASSSVLVSGSERGFGMGAYRTDMVVIVVEKREETSLRANLHCHFYEKNYN